MKAFGIEDCELTDDDLEMNWDIELDSELADISLKALRRIDRGAFEKLEEIDRRLSDCATIGKTHDGGFLIYWDERHPDLGRYEEYFPQRDAKQANARVKEWEDLRKRMPASRYMGRLDKAEAFHIIAAFWLPEEFLSDLEN